MLEETTRPDRQILWNVEDPLRMIMLALVAFTFVYLFIKVRERIRIWNMGTPMTEQATLVDRAKIFLPLLAAEIGTQRKFFSDPYAGFMHFSLFWGIIILLIATTVVFIEEIFLLGLGIHFPPNNYFLYTSLIWDFGGFLALTGVLMAIFRRTVIKKPHSDSTMDDRLILSVLLFQILSGFALEGLRQLGPVELHGKIIREFFDTDWSIWSPGGYAWASLFNLFNMSDMTLKVTHFVLWWVHAIVNALIPVYAVLRFSKFVHVALGPTDLFFRNLRSRGTLYPIPNIEEAETFGAGKIEDFSWKQLMQTDACTRCARCTDVCPANSTGKVLSPMMIVQKVRSQMNEYGQEVIAAGGDTSKVPQETIKVPAGEVVSEEELWDCVTCGACMEACPVFIEHIPMIVDMRRNLVMEQGSLPQSAETALRSIETRGNPGFGTTHGRADWTEGLEVPIAAEVGTENIDVLFWVGCAGSLEDRSIRVAQSVTKIMQKAGVKFAILGNEETCTGDPARRLGNEYLFQLQAMQNIETFNAYNIKKIVTMCPHCFNSIGNEYPLIKDENGVALMKDQVEVVHHSQFLNELLSTGQVKINQDRDTDIGIATYHDPCYLGRHNGVYDPPREALISVIGNDQFTEMEPHRNKAFCCGAGGGHYWFEETEGTEKIPSRRTSHAIDSGAKTIGTACPYCTQMFELGIKTHDKEEEMQVLDLSEMIVQRLDEPETEDEDK
ncbi:heterodisulfide reductase-related iron-sulfur binding cluster [Dehalococcoidia bacterium]|nr:heterodisulfide reductase-related iron-sulfur binding cluster [Dehalococcoidia bacterium]